MYHEEHPKEYTFTRYREVTPEKKVSVDAAWADVLTGRDLQKYLAARTPNESVMARLRALSQGRMTAPGKKF